MRGVRLASLLALVLALSGGIRRIEPAGAGSAPRRVHRLVSGKSGETASGNQVTFQVPDTQRGRPAAAVSRVVHTSPVRVRHTFPLSTAASNNSVELSSKSPVGTERMTRVRWFPGAAVLVSRPTDRQFFRC